MKVCGYNFQNQVCFTNPDVNSALEAMERLGEGDSPLDPFYSLLEGGREGELMREIVDMFYYAQIREEGEESMEVRRAKDFIKLEQIPNIMRSLGFYPSEQEVGGLKV